MIRTTSGQLRGLRNWLVIIAVVTVLLILGTVRTNGGLSKTLGLYAAGAGIGTVTVLWSYAVYARAFTQCSPAGIRTRGLSGATECPWAQVASIELRPYKQTVTVMVTTASGVRFRLGAPVNGGVMGDPEFGSKVEAIQQYWLAVTAAPPASASDSAEVGSD